MSSFERSNRFGFGLVPHRPDDSLGVGMAWSWLKPNLRDQIAHERKLRKFYPDRFK
jgi:hypothetical protein